MGREGYLESPCLFKNGVVSQNNGVIDPFLKAHGDSRYHGKPISSFRNRPTKSAALGVSAVSSPEPGPFLFDTVKLPLHKKDVHLINVGQPPILKDMV